MALLHGCQLPISLLNLIFESCLCLLFFSSYVKSKSVSHVSHVQVFATPWTICSPPGSSVHGILPARIQEWVAIPFSRGSSWPKEQTWISGVTGRFFTIWATREALYFDYVENKLTKLAIDVVGAVGLLASCNGSLKLTSVMASLKDCEK